MPACVNDPRIDQIARATDEISRCAAYRGKEEGLGGAILGEMDWIEELHRLIWEWKEDK